MSGPVRTSISPLSGLSLSIGQVMKSIAALAVLLGAFLTLGKSDDFILPILAFFVLTNLFLRLYLVLWPTIGHVLLGIGGSNPDPEGDVLTIEEADDDRDSDPIRDDSGFPQS